MPPIVGSWEIEALDDPSKWFALSRAYLDSGIRLCEQMVLGSFDHNYANGQVIMGLFHHSVELFYKGVIHRATGQTPCSSHNLFDLACQAKKVAPQVAEAFLSPFDDDVLDGSDAKTLAKNIGNERDQRFRYLHDRKGQPWSGIRAFMPENLLAYMRYCESQYDALIPLTNIS